jgi:hypothetical protein
MGRATAASDKTTIEQRVVSLNEGERLNAKTMIIRYAGINRERKI